MFIATRKYRISDEVWHMLSKKYRRRAYKNTIKIDLSKCMLRHGVLRVFVSFSMLGFCTGHFVMVPLNLTYLHC